MGDIFSCGSNTFGQLGIGDKDCRSALTQLKFPRKRAAAMCAGSYSFYLLCMDGSLYACGNNLRGHLGVGDCEDRHTLTALKITISAPRRARICAGRNTFYVFDGKKSLFACGDNNDGQIGIEGGWGKNALTKFEPGFGSEFSASRHTKIAAGTSSFYVYDGLGGLYACGSNFAGQLGIRCKKADLLTKLDIATRRIQICCGSYSLFALLDDGYLYACGNNFRGKLGFGGGDDRNKMRLTKINFPQQKRATICADENIFYLLDCRGHIYSCGSNDTGWHDVVTDEKLRRI